MNCWICGKPGAHHRGIGEREPLFGDLVPFEEKSQRCYCEECFKKTTEQYKKDMSEYVRLKKKMMFERAVRILERQCMNIYDYQEAIKAVESFTEEKPDKFDSSYEMIAAVILVQNEIPCELQHRIGKYQCDFYIPSMKVILEIDGERHKNKKIFDTKRDAEIMRTVGRDWNIIRIKTEYLDQKAEKLVEAIDAILYQRKT